MSTIIRLQLRSWYGIFFSCSHTIHHLQMTALWHHSRLLQGGQLTRLIPGHETWPEPIKFLFFVWDRVIQGTVLVFIRSRLFLINIYIYSYQECSPSNFWKSDAIKVHKLFSCTLETLPSKFIFKVFYTSIMNAWQVWFIYVIKNFLLFIKWNLIFYGQHVTCIIMLLILDSLVLKKINEFSKSIWFI